MRRPYERRSSIALACLLAACTSERDENIASGGGVGWSGGGSSGAATSDQAPAATTDDGAMDSSEQSAGSMASVGVSSSAMTAGDREATASTDSADSAATSDASNDETSADTTCEVMGGELDFSYIWIANSTDGTISKIDTVTGTELGRYIVRPDRLGNPSRTSVNGRGDVVVANRSGGVTKVYARPSDCQESNGIPGIQTSTGPDDVLPWGQEECIAWYTPVGHDNNRPVAWTHGRLNPRTCGRDGVHVWTSYLHTAIDGTVQIAQLDGERGTIIDRIPMPTTERYTHGLYGAAVDADDNAWFSQLQGGQLVRVNAIDHSVDIWEVGEHIGYGMTVTSEGYVWICGLGTHRFDPNTETWQTVQTLNENAYIHTGGCNGDGRGVLYRASHNDVIGIDTETLQTVVTLPVRQMDEDYVWGVAVDFTGFVWAIPRNGVRAYKLDPSNAATPVVLTVTGLIDSYTYSDMTGFSLYSLTPPG
jgi:hypothetical protein